MASDRQLGCVFLIRWILNNVFGLAVGIFLYGVFGRMLLLAMESSRMVSMGEILGGISIGFVVGYLQSSQLKPWLSTRLRWTIASILGWAFAMIWFENPIQEINLLILFKFLLPLIVGILQWYVLRGLIRRAGWWVVWSYIGLILTFMLWDYLSGKFAGASSTIYPIAIFIPVLLFPIPYSVITGIGLLWTIGGRQEITKLVRVPRTRKADN